ncbi:MAG: hypothetical protein OEX77_11740, partial [Candidatus Bathyarchaeota archaeon]|nr:hypothetical protein [Candidatus Bathyarchaeota archaeon]
MATPIIHCRQEDGGKTILLTLQSGTNLTKRNRTSLVCTLLLSALLTFSVFSTIPATTSDFQQEKIQNVIQPTLQTTSPIGKNQTFTPVIRKPFWVDQNNNNVADTLDKEITNRLINNTAENHVNVIVALKTQPTADDANAFALSGGYLTTSPWTKAIYGFGGQIPYNKIANFIQADSNVLLVDKEHICHAQVAYAAQQIGARTYVWNTLSLQGDLNSSIAILDTGIDDSHPDFSPGFDDKNFTNKIVGWNDQVN